MPLHTYQNGSNKTLTQSSVHKDESSQKSHRLLVGMQNGLEKSLTASYKLTSTI